MAARAEAPKVKTQKSLWERFLGLLIPPWIQVGATILCLGIVYLMDLWVRPQEARLKVEKQAAQAMRNQVIDLEKRLPQEKGQDLQARIREAQGVTVDTEQHLQQTLEEMAQIVKKEVWKAKITPAAATPPTPAVPSLLAVPVVLELSVPPDFSESNRESDQTRLLRLLRKLAELKPKHQLVGLEIRADPSAGFSAKLTYHIYRIRRG